MAKNDPLEKQKVKKLIVLKAGYSLLMAWTLEASPVALMSFMEAKRKRRYHFWY
jgi:hypothetical protein